MPPLALSTAAFVSQQANWTFSSVFECGACLVQVVDVSMKYSRNSHVPERESKYYFVSGKELIQVFLNQCSAGSFFRSSFVALSGFINTGNQCVVIIRKLLCEQIQFSDFVLRMGLLVACQEFVVS